MANLTIIYQNLRLFAYYKGGVNIDMIKAGFARVGDIVETFAGLIRF